MPRRTACSRSRGLESRRTSSRTPQRAATPKSLTSSKTAASRSGSTPCVAQSRSSAATLFLTPVYTTSRCSRVAKRRTAGFSSPVMIAVIGRRPWARHIAKRSRLSPIESASLNGLSPFESLTPALKTPSQSRTSPRHAAARSARRSTGATKTPPSAANAAAISVNDAECGPISSLKSTRRFPRSRASPGARSTGPLALRTEQTEAHEILDIENAGGPLAVDDDDAVDLEFLEELDRFVQHGFFADRDRILREAD